MAHQQGGGMKVAEVQRQVDDVKAVMQENVDVMLQNIDKTEVLEAKTADLAANAKTFHKSSREVKRTMCKQNAKCAAPPPACARRGRARRCPLPSESAAFHPRAAHPRPPRAG